MGPEVDTWCEYCGTELTNRPHEPGCPALRVEKLEAALRQIAAEVRNAHDGAHIDRDDVCEHGLLRRKCDSCALLVANKRVSELERFVLAIAHGPDGSVSDSVRKRAKELWDQRTTAESISALINMLSNPHDGCDFGDSEVEALRQTIRDAIAALLDLQKELSAS